MGRPPQSERRDTRRALIDAGLELFSEKGYFGTSLREVAQSVGIRESALYHYFESKDALFEAILVEREGIEPMLDLLREPIDDPSVLLEALGLATLERFATPRERKLYRILLSDGLRLAAEGRINFLERVGAGAKLMRSVMERLVGEGWLRGMTPEFLAMEFVAPFMVWRQIHAAQPSHPFVNDPRAFVRKHVDQFLRGAEAQDRKRDS
jgi:AcrR family transcriptional regulator